MFETDLVIDTRVIDERIDVTKRGNRLLDDSAAVLGRRKIHGNETGLEPLGTQLPMQLLTGQWVPIYGNCNGAFLGTGFADRCADSLRAARYQHDFILKLQVHELEIVAKRVPSLGSSGRGPDQTLAAKVQETSINRVVRTRDERRFVRAKKQSKGGDLLRLSHSPDGL